MNMVFTKATKKQARLRMALIGPSGSGKTFSALKIAKHLGGRVAVIDTERGSASKYADQFEFDTLNLETFSPATYVEAIHAAEAAGYEILVIDSLSHAWMGREGALEQVDKAAKRSQSNNTYTAWRDVTPMNNALIDAMIGSRCHVIATMRSKTEYVLEPNEKGKMTPKKVGLAPVQRDGMEYEFDLVADMNLENEMIVSKSRCPAMTGAVIAKPGKEVAATLKSWLTDGEVVKEQPVSSEPTMYTREDAASKPKPPEVEKPWTSDKISKETAMIETNKEGVPYWDMETKDLVYRYNALRKKIEENGMTPEVKEKSLLRADILKAIIEYRNS